MRSSSLKKIHLAEEDALLVDDDEVIVEETSKETSAARRLVVPEIIPARLDKVMAELVPEISRSRLRQWIDAGAVTVNAQPAKARQNVMQGDVIVFEVPLSLEDNAYTPEAMALDLVFEDESILVLNKPAGLVVHPAPGHWSGTLVNGLLAYDARLAGVPRAGIVHRLDADTSGLMVVARNLQAHAHLVAQLQARTVWREYWAIAYGVAPLSGTIETPIGRDPRNPLRFCARGGQGAKEARTHFRCLAHSEDKGRSKSSGFKFSWLACKLDTGRTHQIRVHLESIHLPLVGDGLYRLHRPGVLPDNTANFKRQALHAARLGLQHPASGAVMSWSAVPPPDMRALMRALKFSVPRKVVSAFDEAPC